MGGGNPAGLRATPGVAIESANERSGSHMKRHESGGIFYGWWVVAAAFLNLFFVVGVIFYGFPVFYPSFVESLGFGRAQVMQGFLLGFLVIGLLRAEAVSGWYALLSVSVSLILGALAAYAAGRLYHREALLG